MRILITGNDSYIGKRLGEWLRKHVNEYQVEFLSVRTDGWKKHGFSNYDAIVHVAAIVHEKEKPEMKKIYFNVNKELTIELANKAKQSGVNQFIFLSTISVYGLIGSVNRMVVIDKKTPCQPSTLYGKSKYEAELEIKTLQDAYFNVAILRPPMVYGPKCSGNYERLKIFILKTPIFPLVKNKRSMIFIDNLSECIRLILENHETGLFFPQNKEYVNTSDLAHLIAKQHGKRIHLSHMIALGIKIFGGQNIIKKVFGNLVLDFELSNYKNFEYCVSSLNDSIK